MKHRLIHGNSIEWMCDQLAFVPRLGVDMKGPNGIYDTGFADVPDNIGLKYKGVKDRRPSDEYLQDMENVVFYMSRLCVTFWVSFNARYTLDFGHFIRRAMPGLIVKPCVQTFTFGQHNKHDLGNNHRPLWRCTYWDKPTLYPDKIKVPSWRQLNGDKRAAEGGRVPGDVFDFPRVTGNSKQRRDWHPTQLHEDLVKRCLLLTTPDNGTVLDPFAGTGTTLRVCKELGFKCTTVELSASYVAKLREEHPDLEYTDNESSSSSAA